jgi:hypothetical protein
VALWKREPPPDPFERMARRTDPQYGQLGPVNDVPLPGLRGKNLLLLFFAGVIVVALFREGPAGGRPQLEKSCTKAAYKLSREDVPRYGVVRWSAAGPSDASVVFALDTTTVPPAGSDHLLAGPLPLTGCLRTGLFGVRADEGVHRVAALLVRADGTSTVLGSSSLRVNAP